jgi:hypothetical protein
VPEAAAAAADVHAAANDRSAAHMHASHVGAAHMNPAAHMSPAHVTPATHMTPAPAMPSATARQKQGSRKEQACGDRADKQRLA